MADILSATDGAIPSAADAMARARDRLAHDRIVVNGVALVMVSMQDFSQGSRTGHSGRLVAWASASVALACVVVLMTGCTRSDQQPVSTPVSSAPSTVQGPRSTLLIADAAGFIEKVTPDGVVSIVAGNGDNKSAPVPGPAIDSPMHPYDVAVGPDGSIFIADYNGYVERVTPDGMLSVVAGNGQNPISSPRPGPVATDSALLPMGIDSDASGNLFIASFGLIVEVTPDGVLSIIAGTGIISGAPVPGPAIDSPIDPIAVAVDKAGNLYAADHSNGYVVRITTEGVLSILASPSTYATPAPSATMNYGGITPYAITVGTTGNVYTAEYGGPIERMTPDGAWSVVDDIGGYGIAVDRAENIYAATTASVFQITSDGVRSCVANCEINGPMKPYGVAVWPS